MLRFIKFFHGYLHVRISGYSPERFLNLCSRMNIVLWSLLPTEDGYRFCISRRAFDMIEPALEKTGTQITVVRRIGLPFLISRYRKHVFFLAGLFLAGFLLFFMSLFIWKVEIEGNSLYSTQTILDFLDENGVGYASGKAGIDCGEVENMLRAEFEDITWASASIRGTRLYLVIQERLAGSSDTGETDEEEAATNLVASDSGTVESITVRSGTPLVGVGDTVEAGDVLVTGAIGITDDSGEVVAYHFVSCDADILIHTTLSYSDTFSSSYEKKILTGSEKIRLTLCFDSYFFDIFRSWEEGNYLEADTVCPVVIGSDFYLPFQIIKREYAEYEILRGTWSEEEVQELARARLEKYCENLEENGVQILSNSVIIEQSGGSIFARGELEALAGQTDYREILTEEMEAELPDGIGTADDGDPD